MRIRHKDGWLEVDFNDRGSNFYQVVKCTEEVFEKIEYETEIRDAYHLSDLMECILEHASELDYIKGE